MFCCVMRRMGGGVHLFLHFYISLCVVPAKRSSWIRKIVCPAPSGISGWFRPRHADSKLFVSSNVSSDSTAGAQARSHAYLEGQVVDVRDVCVDGHGRYLPFHQDDPSKFEVVAIASNNAVMEDLMKKEKVVPVFTKASEDWNQTFYRTEEIFRLIPMAVSDEDRNDFITGVNAIHQKLSIPMGESVSSFLSQLGVIAAVHRHLQLPVHSRLRAGICSRQTSVPIVLGRLSRRDNRCPRI
ncbi:unnamed protein product [Prorocentrum cordatum]|uniref:Uncharacterized protein n=1 Tax=Prorocentrum cordatum TaxID=2364126 RepID=A0ABN9WS00_9DINO|nr:unnamed protein product [Polarella glacialis]